MGINMFQGKNEFSDMNLYSHNELSVDALLVLTDVLKDFDSRTEVIGLKCQYGKAEGISDHANMKYVTLVHT